MKRKIKIFDTVKIISGSDKNKVGKVIKVLDNKFLFIENIKMVKKCIKRSNNNINKNFNYIESKIHISNVLLIKKHNIK